VIVQVSVDFSEISEEQVPNCILHAPHSTKQKVEKDYVALLQSFIDAANFYFSYDYDITHTAQRQSKFTPGQRKQPLWMRVFAVHLVILIVLQSENRFFWNRYLMADFIRWEAHELVLPAMDGYIFFASCCVALSLTCTLQFLAKYRE
jgi:hypothetical protein